MANHPSIKSVRWEPARTYTYEWWLRVVRSYCSAANDGLCAEQVLRSVAFMCWEAHMDGRKAFAWKALDNFHGREYVAITSKAVH